MADERSKRSRQEERQARKGNSRNRERIEQRDREHGETRRYRGLATVIGERIRAVRAGQRRSRSQLARAANLADSHLGEIERGEIVPGSSTLAKLAVALRVEAGVLFPDLRDLALLVGLEIGQEEEDSVKHPPYLGQLESAEAGPETTGKEGTASGKVETLLSPAVAAKMVHVEARTLQKWIALGLVTPSFYVLQEQRSPRQEAAGTRESEVSRSAAFRREDLPDIIQVRNRARVRQKRNRVPVTSEVDSD